MGSQTFSSSSTWVAPNGVNTVIAECWGGGGPGAAGGIVTGGGGGGGGGYAKVNSMPVIPGKQYIVTVGALTAAGDGNGKTSTFIGESSTKCEAIGGNTASGATGGSGAPSASCTGDVKYGGGNGGNGGLFTADAGGGEGACTDKNGGNASGATPGSGGDGGDGGTPSGGDGNITGGGGAGVNTGTAGSGARGQVKITYTDPINLVENIRVIFRRRV